MRLADRIAQCRTPFVVKNTKDHSVTHLSGAANFSQLILGCPTRYVLNDALARLCTALAYSKGARTLACADLLHVPAERVWVEWCEGPWLTELQTYGFKPNGAHGSIAGRRGAFIESSVTGRSGLIRTFWTTGDSELDVLASSMETYFDFDTADGAEPAPPQGEATASVCVFDDALGRADILRRCFRFRFERTWADYYGRADLSRQQREALALPDPNRHGPRANHEFRE